MPEFGAASLLSLATACAAMGMSCLALGMEVHWQQVARPGQVHRRVRWRATGATLLCASLLLCLQADRASMAVLVWVMLLALGAGLTAQVLAWRPGLLRWLARMG